MDTSWPGKITVPELSMYESKSGHSKDWKTYILRVQHVFKHALPLRRFQHVVTISLGLPLHIRTLQFLLFFHSCFNGSMDVRPTILLG